MTNLTECELVSVKISVAPRFEMSEAVFAAIGVNVSLKRERELKKHFLFLKSSLL